MVLIGILINMIGVCNKVCVTVFHQVLGGASLQMANIPTTITHEFVILCNITIMDFSHPVFPN